MDATRWAALKTAFADCVELDPAERSRRLRDLATTDPVLARRLEELLEADAHADSILEEVAPGGGDGSSAGPAPDPFGLVGRTVSHFHVLEVLGAGGMGVLYRAEDIRLDRFVALKFLLPQYALDATARERFVREARAASALDHPNICNVHEVGETSEGWPFLAMTCYRGETLKTRLERGALDVGEAVGVARQVLRGLEAAHAAQIVHRDLKPGNLMLTPDGVVKILDFGLAKVRDLALTEPEERVGTVAYMSPEQLDGGPLDARTDLWSLGVVLHEMLTGRLPFGTGHDLAMLYTILHGDPAPPSALRDGVPAALDAVVYGLLRKDRDERYATATEVVGDLERSSAESIARGEGLPARIRRAADQQPVGVGTTGRPGGSSAPVGPARPRNDSGSVALEPATLAVLPFLDLSPDRDRRYFSEGMTDELIGLLSKVEGLRVIARSSSARFRERVADIRDIGRRLGVAHVLDGSVRLSDRRVRVTVLLVSTETGYQEWSETFERNVDDIFALQEDIGRAIVESLRLHIAPPGGSDGSGAGRVAVVASPTDDLEAYELFLRGRFFANRRTENGLARAAEYFRKAIAADPGFARAHAGLADTFIAPRESAPGERFRAGREAALRALELDPTLAEAHTAMGWIRMWNDRDWTAAERDFQRALASNPGYLWAHQWYSAYLAATGRLEEALAALRRAHRIDPLSVTTIVHIGSELFWLGRYEEAIARHREALALQPGFFMAQWGIGRACIELGRHEEAIRAFESDLPSGGTDCVGFFKSGLLGHAHAVGGDESEARRILSDLRARLDAGVYVAPTELAAIHIGLGEYEPALDWLERHEEDRGARIFLAVDPLFDPVRSHPRFAGLLDRLGLG